MKFKQSLFLFLILQLCSLSLVECMASPADDSRERSLESKTLIEEYSTKGLALSEKLTELKKQLDKSKRGNVRRALDEFMELKEFKEAEKVYFVYFDEDVNKDILALGIPQSDGNKIEFYIPQSSSKHKSYALLLKRAPDDKRNEKPIFLRTNKEGKLEEISSLASNSNSKNVIPKLSAISSGLKGNASANFNFLNGIYDKSTQRDKLVDTIRVFDRKSLKTSAKVPQFPQLGLGDISVNYGTIENPILLEKAKKLHRGETAWVKVEDLNKPLLLRQTSSGSGGLNAIAYITTNGQAYVYKDENTPGTMYNIERDGKTLKKGVDWGIVDKRGKETMWQWDKTVIDGEVKKVKRLVVDAKEIQIDVTLSPIPYVNNVVLQAFPVFFENNRLGYSTLYGLELKVEKDSKGKYRATFPESLLSNQNKQPAVPSPTAPSASQNPPSNTETQTDKKSLTRPKPGTLAQELSKNKGAERKDQTYEYRGRYPESHGDTFYELPDGNLLMLHANPNKKEVYLLVDLQAGWRVIGNRDQEQTIEFKKDMDPELKDKVENIRKPANEGIQAILKVRADKDWKATYMGYLNSQITQRERILADEEGASQDFRRSLEERKAIRNMYNQSKQKLEPEIKAFKAELADLQQ